MLSHTTLLRPIITAADPPLDLASEAATLAVITAGITDKLAESLLMCGRFRICGLMPHSWNV